MPVRIECARSAGMSVGRIRGLAEKAAEALGRKGDDIAIVFLGAGKARKMNREYRRRDEATDILSFPAGVKGDLGDIFICPPVARKKAALRGEGYREYLALLVVHGVLHLGGYDHHTDRESKRMEKMEEKILRT